MIEQPADSDYSARSEQAASKRSWLEDGIHDAVGLIVGDDRTATKPGQSNLRTEVEHYSAEVLKTAPLFLPAIGRLWAVAGYGGSAILQGLDQVHTGDTASRQAADFALGCAKGALTKGTFEVLGKADFGALNKAVDWGVWPKALGGKPLELTGKAFSFGVSNRLLDTSLSSQTWLDQSGNIDVARGLRKTTSDMVRPSALLTDVAVFAGSPILLKGANLALRGALDRSLLAQTIGTGSSFGLLSGSLFEAQRQYNEDGHFDAGKIAWRGFLQAGATGLGATAGGLRANYLASSQSAVEKESGVAKDKANDPQLSSGAIRSVGAAWMGAGLFADGADALNQANVRHSTAAEPAAVMPALQNATPAELLGVQVAEHAAAHMDASEGALSGAKQYRTDSGLEFWQLADGRILSQTTEPVPGEKKYDNATLNIWIPQASEERFASGRLQPFSQTVINADGDTTQQESMRHLRLDERHGLYRDIDGAPYYWYTRTNLFDSTQYVPDVDKATIDRLHIVAPNAEKDWQSERRILPLENGELFERRNIHRWQKVPAEPLLNGKPSQRVKLDEEPGRVYHILTQEQTVSLADLKEQMAAGAIDREMYNAGLRKLSSEGVAIAVPETYALRLDALRELRRVATLSPTMVPEMADDILKARRELFTSPYRDRLLPEQMGQYLESLPDRSKVGALYLLDGSSKQYTFSGAVADAREDLRRVRIFGGADSATDQVGTILKHEWTHLVEDGNRSLFGLYNAARRIDDFSARDYANKDTHEHWAVNFGEMFLDADSEMFLTLAHAAPIKTVILADVLSRAMKNVPRGQGTSDADVLNARLNYVNQVIEPIAKEKLNNSTGSKYPNYVAQAADVVASFSSNSDGRQLLDRLFDKKKLVHSIDTGVSEKSEAGQFDWALEARKLMRLEMLRHVDPAAFSARQSEYNAALSTTSAVTRAFMLTADHPDNVAVRQFGESLAKSNSLRGLFGQLFPTMDLVRAALNTKDETAARQAFSLITGAAPNAEAASAALQLLNTKSPARLDAAKFLMDDKQLYYMRKGADAISKLMEKDAEFASPDFAKYLSDRIDKGLDLSFDAPRVVRILHRGQLLEQIVNHNPSLLDEPMKERLAHLNNVKLRTRDWIAAALKPSFFLGVGSDVPVVMNMLDGLSRSEDKSTLALARELAPRMVLEQALRTTAVQDPRLLDVAYRLYGADMNPLVLQLASSAGPLRDVAVKHGVDATNLELLKQMKPIMGEFSNWGNERLRLDLVDRLSRRIGWAANRTDLNGQLRERMGLRLDLLKELIKPMRMDVFGQSLEQLSSFIESAQKRLEETAPAEAK
ncbi:MAG TPA: hypothetical protein V6D22_01690 [Candidatus Obscuribacterales bacterium]